VESIEINILDRTERKSSGNAKLRREGFVPGVVYSGGEEASSIKIELLHFRRNISGKGRQQLFTLKSDNSNLDGLMALLKEVQSDPLKGTAKHVDFYVVRTGQKIRVSIPVVLTGECEVVKIGEAILNHLLHEVDVECVPREIPPSLALDISDLQLGHSLQVGDIQLPENVELKTDIGSVVVSVVQKKEEVEEEVPVEEEEGVEGEAPAEGEEAKEGDAAEKPAEEEKKEKEKD